MDISKVTKIVIFSASIKEVNAILYQTNIKFIKNGNIFSTNYKSIYIQIYITGIGANTVDFFNHFNIGFNINNEDNSEILYFKFGTCGVINGNIPLLNIVSPNIIYYEDNFIKLNNIYSTNNSLITINKKSDFALDYNFATFDLIDMEMFFVVEKIKNVIPILITTDYNNEKEFFCNLIKATSILKDFFIDLLNGMNSNLECKM